QGKIGHWGVSNAPVGYMRRAHSVFLLTATQNQYSMNYREPEVELFDLCKEIGIGFEAYSPLGSGFLSGKYSSQKEFGSNGFRSFMGRFKPEVMKKIQAVLDLLGSIAEDKGATSAQIVLAWELAQNDFIVLIPG